VVDDDETKPVETGTGNIETIAGCCFAGGGGCLGRTPTTAVTLTSDPDKARANSEAAEADDGGGTILFLAGLR
jgi:hypothetical protein